MGTCCSKRSVIEINNKKNITTKGLSYVILEQYSKQTDYKKKYEFVSLLGNGGFGKVRLFRDRLYPDMKYAIKTIKKDFLNHHNIESIIQEVNILNNLDHPNIVRYFETYEDDHYIHIVMEYIPGENLFKVIINRKKNKFCEKDAAEILNYLFKAIKFLHQNNIVHRDIKPENILFSVSGKYNSLKLIDFGLSASVASKDRYRVGSPFYMAPEMLKGRYHFSTDIWSIGIILFVMMTGTYPFPGRDQNEVFEKIKKGVYDILILDKVKVSVEVKDLIKKLLVYEVDKRLSIDDALIHPWIVNNLQDNDKSIILDDNIIESISNFAKNNILQKEILFYLAKISTEKEIIKLKKTFEEIDKDRSGTIETEEIFQIFERLGKRVDKSEIHELWKGMDFHRDGKVNYSEFLAATLSSVEFMKEERVWSAFKYFDIHDNGLVTFESMIEALKSNNIAVNETGLNDVFNEMKIRNKGLNFVEFRELIEKK